MDKTVMTHDYCHCTGENGTHTCKIRESCMRYQLHLDAVKRNINHCPYLFHVNDGGQINITSGCSEYVPE